MAIQIDERIEERLFKLRVDEYKQLEQNIIDEGCREDLIVGSIIDENKNMILFDGHNRYKICNENNITYNIKNKDFETIDAVLTWVDKNQYGRRNLTDKQRDLLLGRMYKKEKKKHGGDRKSSAQNGHLIKTSETMADTYNVSKNTVKRAERFYDAMESIKPNINKETYDKILTNEYKISKKDITVIADKIKSDKQEDVINKVVTKKVKSVPAIIKKIEKEKVIEQKIEQINLIKEKTKDFKLYNSDCRDILKDLNDNSIDLVLTDPPYGINFKHSWSKDKDFKNDGNEYVNQLLNDVCSELKGRVCKDDAHLYFFTSWKNYPTYINILEKYFDISNKIVWVKDNTSLVDFDKRYAFKYEEIIFCKQKGNNERYLNNNQSADVLNYDKISNPYHSCEKPVELLEYFILNSTLEGEVVIDMFSGTGNTGIAGLKNKRKFIGIEIDKSWFQIMEGNINEQFAKQIL